MFDHPAKARHSPTILYYSPTFLPAFLFQEDALPTYTYSFLPLAQPYNPM